MRDMAEHRRHVAEQRVDRPGRRPAAAAGRAGDRRSRQSGQSGRVRRRIEPDERDGGADLRARQPRPRGGRASSSWWRRRCARACRNTISPPAISNSPARRSATGSPRWRARGARRILAVPGMLFAASHVKNDLPWEMNSFIADNPGIDVRLGRDLAIDAKLLNAAADRIAAAAAARNARRDAARRRRARHQRPRRQFQHRQDRPHAVGGDGLRLGRGRLQRGRPSARRRGARPRRAARLSPHRRVSRISCSPACWSNASTPRPTRSPLASRRSSSSRRAICATIRGVLDAFCDRVGEIAEGQPAMNCQLCKYRAQIIGYETRCRRAADRATTTTCAAPASADHHHGIIRPPSPARARPARHRAAVRHIRDRRLERGEPAEDRARQHLDLLARPRRRETRQPADPARGKGAARRMLAAAVARGERVLVGFDFPFGYPGGVRRAARPRRAAVARGLGRDRPADRGRRATTATTASRSPPR